MSGPRRASWWGVGWMVCLLACGSPVEKEPDRLPTGEAPGPDVQAPRPSETPSLPESPTQGSPDAKPVEDGASSQGGGETRWFLHRPPELDGNRSVRRVSALGHDAQGHVYAALAGEDHDGPVPRVLMVLEKLTPAGGLVWKRTFSVAPDGYWHSAAFLEVAAAPEGHVFFGATVRGQVDFGGGPLGGAVLVRLSPEGRHVWSRRLGPTYDSVIPRALAVAPDGALLVTGFFRGAVDFGGRTLTSTEEGDSFVARYGEDGSLDWVRAVDAPSAPGVVSSHTEVMSLAVDSTGHVVLGGHFIQKLAPENPEPQVRDGPVLMRWSPQGQTLWRKDFNANAEGDGSLSGSVYHVGVSALGTVVAAGSANGLMRWAGETRELWSEGNHGFLAVAEPGGSERFLRDFPDAFIAGFAMDPAGRVYLGGLGPARIDFGSGPTEELNGNHPFVTRFNLDGTHAWGRVFVTENPPLSWSGISSLTFLPGQGVVVGGQFSNRTDFGTGWIDPVFWDGFLVLLKP